MALPEELKIPTDLELAQAIEGPHDEGVLFDVVRLAALRNRRWEQLPSETRAHRLQQARAVRLMLMQGN